MKKKKTMKKVEGGSCRCLFDFKAPNVSRKRALSRRMCSFEQTIIQSQVHKKTAVLNKGVTRIKGGENGDQSIVQDRHEPKTNTCSSVNLWSNP